MTINDALKTKNTRLFFINDKNTNNAIFAILINRIGHWHIENTDNIYFIEDNIEIDFQLYNKEYTNFILNLNKNASIQQLLHYIDKFSNIQIWLNCTYKPKWQESLKDKFYDAVVDYIKNDIYLFCNAIDGTSSYEDTINEKIWIKK